MGNKHCRKPSKKASISLSTSSTSSSFGAAPNSVSKGTNTAGIMSGEKGIMEAAAGMRISESGNALRSTPNMGFISWKTGSLDTPAFQPRGYIPKKVQTISRSKELSGLAPAFVPGAQGKNVHQTAVSGASGARQPLSAPLRKPNTSAAVSKIQNLIHDMQKLPASNATRHGKHFSDASTAQSTNSGVSVATSGTAPSPSPLKVRDSIIRVHPRQKDLVISAAGIIRNRFHVDELELANGVYVHRRNASSDPTNVLGELAKKDEATKERFWLNHHVQIIVDLFTNSDVAAIDTKQSGKEKDVSLDVKGKGKEVVFATVIDHMAKLGKDFFKYAIKITVDLVFPPPREGSVAIRTHGRYGVSNNPTQSNISSAITNPGFATLQQLVAKLDNCVSMEFLEVVIHNPTSSSNQPFTIEQLMYGLPFYDLRFKDWQMKWQGSYMTKSIDVGYFPTVMLDKERNKWLWARRRAKREAEIVAKREQQRIDNMVFTTKSIAPEWQKHDCLLQPFPATLQSLPAEDAKDKEGL